MYYNRWMPVQCSSEMYHHGVKGMKWGVRKDRNSYSEGSLVGNRRGLQSELNRTDKQLGRDRYNAGQTARKLEKAQRKGASLKKQNKLSSKLKNYDASIENGYKKTQALLKDVKKSGFSVSQRSTKRAYVRGKDIAIMAASVPVMAITGWGMMSWASLPGTKYKVRE